MMKKALGSSADRSRLQQEEQLKQSLKEQVPKKKIGKSPLIGKLDRGFESICMMLTEVLI